MADQLALWKARWDGAVPAASAEIMEARARLLAVLRGRLPPPAAEAPAVLPVEVRGTVRCVEAGGRLRVVAESPAPVLFVRFPEKERRQHARFAARLRLVPGIDKEGQRRRAPYWVASEIVFLEKAAGAESAPVSKEEADQRRLQVLEALAELRRLLEAPRSP